MEKFDLPIEVDFILNKLHRNGFEAFVVGGCVRDMVLGHGPADFDITTSAEPQDVKNLFDRTIDTGIEHGTVTVMRGKVGYEVTTYRLDGKYTDHRRPESVSFTKSLTEDVKRRDFTINAMAYNHQVGVVDLFDGIGDLKKGIIRCVGNPIQRFEEDALRILRAIRFAARFGYAIDADTEIAIRAGAGLLSKISGERIRMELTKTMLSPHPEYMKKLAVYGILPVILPEFVPSVGLAQNHPYHRLSVDEHVYACLMATPKEEGLLWAVYLHDIGKGYTKSTDEKGIDHFYNHPRVSVKLAKDILARLRFDNKTRDRILKLIDFHDYRFKANETCVRKAAAKMGADLFMDYLAVQAADIAGQAYDKFDLSMQEVHEKKDIFQAILDKEACLTIKDLAIKGGDLMDLGVERGEAIGHYLKGALEVVLEDPQMNTKEALLDYIKREMGEQ